MELHLVYSYYVSYIALSMLSTILISTNSTPTLYSHFMLFCSVGESLSHNNSLVWTHNGLLLSSEVEETDNYTTNILTIPSVRVEDLGVYICTASFTSTDGVSIVVSEGNFTLGITSE